jgi:hypothetical protein
MLQLNILGFKAQMEALINDTETRDLDILLIQEPLSYQHPTHVQLPASSRGPGTPYWRDEIPGTIPVTERFDPIAW